jgi:hypothetical protein
MRIPVLSVILLTAPLLACAERIPPPQAHTITSTGGAPHVVGASLGTEELSVGTKTMTLAFSEPMEQALVTIGDYSGGLSCDEYGAIESVQVSIEQRPGDSDARCIGGTIATEDAETYVITLNSRVVRGDVVWVRIRSNTSVSATPTEVPIVEPVTDTEGVALAHGFAARFEVRAVEFALLSPVWSEDSDTAYESFEPVEFQR